MIETLKSWIESLFKTEGAWTTWKIVMGTVVVILLVLVVLAALWWFIQVIIGYDIGGFVIGLFGG